MPAAERAASGSRVPTVLLWAGIALAPAAGGLFAVGGEVFLRAGGVVAMLAVFLLGLGALLAARSAADADRSAADAVRIDLREGLRAELRGDIAQAARATHRSLEEQIEPLSNAVEAVRGQIDVLRSHVERSHLPPVVPVPPIVPTPEVVPVLPVVPVVPVLPTGMPPAVPGPDRAAGAIPQPRHSERSIPRRPPVAPPVAPSPVPPSPVPPAPAPHRGTEYGRRTTPDPAPDEPRYDEPRYDEPAPGRRSRHAYDDEP